MSRLCSQPTLHREIQAQKEWEVLRLLVWQLYRMWRTSLSFKPNRVLYLSKRHWRDLMYIWWYRFTVSSLGFSIFGTVIGSPTETEQNTHQLPSLVFCALFMLVGICTALSLTNCSDGLAVRHNTPGVSKEEATAMKQAGGKTQDLLKSLLQGSPVASLFKDHLLVGIILSKRIHWDEV